MYNDQITREQRMGTLGTVDDQTTPWGLVGVVVSLIAIASLLGLAGHADLVAKGLIN